MGKSKTVTVTMTMQVDDNKNKNYSSDDPNFLKSNIAHMLGRLVPELALQVLRLEETLGDKGKSPNPKALKLMKANLMDDLSAAQQLVKTIKVDIT